MSPLTDGRLLAVIGQVGHDLRLIERYRQTENRCQLILAGVDSGESARSLSDVWAPPPPPLLLLFPWF